jgi:hypothetical protein
MSVMTASWCATLAATAIPVGISRGVPRMRSGYCRLRELEQGPRRRRRKTSAAAPAPDELRLVLPSAQTREQLLAYKHMFWASGPYTILVARFSLQQ